MTTTSDQTLKTATTEPIPSPDNPLQYRAIGLLWGKYIPSEELTKGTLITSDDTNIDAVILGRLLGLVKARHIDLTQEHFWVVYPRTREEEPKLHVQLAGVWEPETLHPDSPAPTLGQKPDYFSIQGEVVYQHKEEGWVAVKINQKPQKQDDKPSYFNLKLFGFLPERPVKNFWHLHVQREGSNLVIEDGERIAYLGKKKPKKGKPKKGKPTKGKQKPDNAGQQPVEAAASPKEPPKLKKKQPSDEGASGSEGSPIKA